MRLFDRESDIGYIESCDDLEHGVRARSMHSQVFLGPRRYGALWPFAVAHQEPKMSNYDKVKSVVSEMGGAVIGYSGGVDSTLMAKIATDALGDRAVSVMIESCLVPEAEIDDAVSLAESLGLNLVTVSVDALAIDNVPDNTLERCYHCKRALFSEMMRIAKERGLPYVLDGANADDAGEFRPGIRATKELGVRSPFMELGISKEEVRAIARDLGLPNWDKPSRACLASRVPYGLKLNEPMLKQIENAETVLENLGFEQFRVRHHDTVARIEMAPVEMEKVLMPAVRTTILRELKALGYAFVTLDLAGYKTGSFDTAIETDSPDD